MNGDRGEDDGVHGEPGVGADEDASPPSPPRSRSLDVEPWSPSIYIIATSREGVSWKDFKRPGEEGEVKRRAHGCYPFSHGKNGRADCSAQTLSAQCSLGTKFRFAGDEDSVLIMYCHEATKRKII
ncbi:hypothetical protein ABZP36_036032 [Zizania latifolia]